MKLSKIIRFGSMLFTVAFVANAYAQSIQPDGVPEGNPYDSEEQVVIGPNGETPEAQRPYSEVLDKISGCTAMSCHVYVHVAQSQRPQMLYLYIDGQLSDQWLVSTGVPGLPTPNFDRHPDGNFAHGAGSSIPQGFCTSSKYKGGDYYETRVENGVPTRVDLGNMPYCVGIYGGFYIHGEAAPVTGNPASHGCVRSPPEKAKGFLALVESVGIENVWIHID